MKGQNETETWETFHNGGGQVGVRSQRAVITWVAGERLPLDEQIANAKVIAAANDLLDELKYLRSLYATVLSVNCKCDDHFISDQLASADAAIAKATA